MRKSNILMGMHHLKFAVDHFENFIIETDSPKAKNIFQCLCNTIKGQINGIIKHKAFPDEMKKQMQDELNSDLGVVLEIHNLLAKLDPQQRLEVENMLEQLILMKESFLKNNLGQIQL